jgi:hypothetical protein
MPFAVCDRSFVGNGIFDDGVTVSLEIGAPVIATYVRPVV